MLILLSRVTGSRGLLGILVCGLWVDRLWFGDRHGNLLLEDNLISEECDPILEVWHHTISGPPGTLPVGLIQLGLDLRCSLLWG